MPVYTTPLARRVIGCAIEVHATVGPGLLEGTYQRCLAHELKLNGLRFEQEVGLPVKYKTVAVGIGYRVDFLIESELVVEIKAVERLLPVHQAQVLTYLHVLGVRQGLLINFNSPRLAAGVRSVLNSRVRPPE